MKAISVTGAMVLASGAGAQLSFDQDVTPDVIFGSGNANGAFTVDRQNGIELGLRGKLRFDSNNNPQNIFNSNGDGTYTFDAGVPSPGFGFAPNDPGTAVWNFEWSINTNYDNTTGLELIDFTYLLEIDGDPSAGTDFFSFDPINVPYADHSIGDNSTGNGMGVEASDATEYGFLIIDNNVAQNSWNYQFFNDSGTPLENFNGNDVGTYTIRLTAFDSLGAVASTEIDINVVPAPTSTALLGLGGLAVARRRR